MGQSSVRPLRSLILATFAAGCQSAAQPVDVPPPPRPPPPAPSLGIHIVPALGVLPFASTVQFQALTNEGTPAAVRWHLDDPLVGTISQDGLLTTAVCADSRPVVIQATLLADTTQVARLHTFGARTGPAVIYIDSVTNVPGAARTNLDSVAGVVAVHAFLGQSLRCYPLQRILLEDGSTAVPLESLTLDPAVMAPARLTITWDTRTAPNGAYAVRGQAFFGYPTGIVTNTIPLHIRNP